MKTTLCARLGGCLALAGALAIGVVGCGGSAATYPVSGKVVWENGKPATELAGGTVLFEQIVEQDQRAVSAAGEIQPDASFKLTTKKAGDGAPAGKYRVAVTPLILPVDAVDVKKPKRPLVDPDFTTPVTTPLVIDVEAKANDNVQVKVQKGR
jgi:hypothetical protein